MKFKKLASLLIAGAMMFSMAMPAFASLNPNQTQTGSQTTGSQTTGSEATPAAETDLSRSLKFEGMTKVPTIKVTMPATSSIILNPFGLKVGDDESTDEFISDTVRLINESDCKIAVSGTITPSIAGTTKLVDAPNKADTGTASKLAPNNVFVGMSICEVAGEDTEIDFADGMTGITATSTYKDKMLAAATTATNYLKGAKTASGGALATDYGFYILKTADTAVAFGDSTDAVKKDKAGAAAKLPYVLDAGDENPTYLGFRLFGLCETKVATPWTGSDTVSVNMALTLVPYSN